MDKRQKTATRFNRLLHSPESLVALVSFLKSKRGRKLLKRVARTPEGRDLIRAIKEEPGGARLLKMLFRDKAKKAETRRRRDAIA